ncbi:hypothetical protein WPS_14650 [Vulcanimicrobium alpinum]|uniref:PAS domain S-box protein n=1 Tax=Vulcanimicrobium alpinum TaxID=3016050 RepID=A0AAN1XWB8_UNVUL|nr:PAS domain S-box protein [Vulcanimicrobium alpinum]BDE06189.1 hypothetical protein WPS_14650 [Vulcanimicrobium alpinum]
MTPSGPATPGTLDDVLFRELFDAAPTIVFVARPDGTIGYVNPAWTAFSGLPRESILDDRWPNAVEADDADRVVGAWLHAMAHAQPFREQFRFRVAGGEARWVVAHAVPTFRANGSVGAWYGNIVDVDDEYRATQRRAILARLGSAFADSLDFARTARTVVSAVCEDFADFAFLDVIGSDGRLRRVEVEAGRLGGDAESYRRRVPPPEVKGHPINIALASGRPIIVDHTDDAWVDATAWNPEHAAFAHTLPLASVVYAPMIAAGERIGVLTFGAATGTGRRFTESDLDDVQEVARRAAIALTNAKLYADLTSSEARYRGIIDTAQEGVWIIDAQARTTYVNRRLCEMLGYDADEMFGQSIYAFMETEASRDAEHAFNALRTGQTQRFENRLSGKNGRTVWAIVASSPILDAHGAFAGALGMLTDITDRKAIETQYRLLAEATPQIIWTADVRGMMTYVNERWTALTGMPRDEALGYGWCAVVHRSDLAPLLTKWREARDAGVDFETECRLRRASDEAYRWHLVRARARRDGPAGETVEWLGSMTDIDASRRLANNRDIIARAGDVVGATFDVETLLTHFADLLFSEVADEATIRLTGGTEIVRTHVPVPPDAPVLQAQMLHRNEVIGAITLRSRERFDDLDASLLDELAARAAVAIENARLYEREHRVAVTLQRALLPAVLPAVDGLAFDAVYSPGATEAEIGGDWYDAIALDDGRVVVSIGDVTGRGLTAAVIMGRMRQAIETLATYETDPVRLLDAADQVLRRTHPEAIVTALVGVIDPLARTMTYATAGHPTPFVRGADGTVRNLPGRGLPLGLRDESQPPAITVVLPTGALAVFFTDGLTESTRDIAEGERRVIAALHDAAIKEETSPAALIVSRVLDGAIRDDVAVLTVRVTDDVPAAREWTIRWRFDPRDRRRTYDVREALVEALVNFGREIDTAAAQLVFGELVGNAVRHAPGVVDVELTWDDPSTPILHVVDDGPGFASRSGLPNDDAESGRGLFLVECLTRAFSVTRESDRGARATAVLMGRG